MPMDSLLFIGAPGDGDMFASGQARHDEWLPDIYGWEHESDYVAAHATWRHFISEDDSSTGW